MFASPVSHLGRVSVMSGDDDPSSPCPSPTPLFQQLYAAVAHWERVLSGSPELLREVLGKYSPDSGTGDEPEVKMRTATSMHNLTVKAGGDEKGQWDREVSIRRRSSPGSLLVAAKKKKSETNP